jgi:hypothetical protein
VAGVLSSGQWRGREAPRRHRHGGRGETRSAPDWGALQEAIAGDVVLLGSSDYESVRKPAIARFHDVRPQAVVLCKPLDWGLRHRAYCAEDRSSHPIFGGFIFQALR